MLFKIWILLLLFHSGGWLEKPNLEPGESLSVPPKEVKASLMGGEAVKHMEIKNQAGKKRIDEV